jgi:nitroimidazol reductase NimA-like FMN-containing flavoprotein (pyridoxamine 5'-phosphate oxidase superfamily)
MLVSTAAEDGAQTLRPRQALTLTEGECWHLLGSVSVGRVVFTHHAMPAIRPVNHLLDGKTIVIRSHLGTSITARASADHGTVVCYEVDELDPVRHTGWSVMATGTARIAGDPDVITRYAQRLESWIAGELDQIITIEPAFISGIRLVGWCA